MIDRFLSWFNGIGGESGFEGLHVLSLREGHEGLALEVAADDPTNEEAEPIVWDIRADGVQTFALRSSTVWTVDFGREHPLLAPFVSATAELKFDAPPAEPARLAGLFARHLADVAGTWFPTNELMDFSHPWLVGSDTDLDLPPIAAGPLPFLQGLVPIAQGESAEVRLFVGPRPTHVASEPPHVLVLDDLSYVVATRFTAQQRRTTR